MNQSPSKLIILRGNSGSGKSTVAKKLREVSNRKLAIVEQDYLRRFVLKEKENEGTNNLGLIRQTVEYAIGLGYDVVLEGILYFPRYGEMLQRLVASAPESYVFYFDVSLDETLKRHLTKPNSGEFGEKELREWYKLRDLTGLEGEEIIPESYSLEQSVQFICQRARI